MRCQSTLQLAAPIAVHPPRAGRKQKLRRAQYRTTLFLARHLPQVNWTPPWWVKELRRLVWAGLSILPGLGQLLTGRWRSAAWMTPSWLAAMGLGIYFFGTTPAYWLMGLGMALHAWSICDAGGLRAIFRTLLWRVGFTLIVFAGVVFLGYRPLYVRVQDHVRGFWPRSDWPRCDVRGTDFVLLDVRAYEGMEPQRGDLVLYTTANGQISRGFVLHGGDLTGEILAIPGDRVVLQREQMWLAAPGQPVCQRPTPPVLAKLNLDFIVPPNHYFCEPPPTQIALERFTPDPMTILRSVALPGRSDLHGRVFMIYNPPQRRRLIPPGAGTAGPPS